MLGDALQEIKPVTSQELENSFRPLNSDNTAGSQEARNLY